MFCIAIWKFLIAITLEEERYSVAMPDVQLSYNVRRDSLQDEIFIMWKFWLDKSILESVLELS